MEDEANSRQGSRNKLYSYNNNRRDSRRDSRRPKPRDNRHAISQQNNTERRQIDNPSIAKCYNCGNSWPHLNAPCPARGKQCKSYNHHGHFAKVCRSTQQQQRSRSFHRERKHIRNLDCRRSPSTPTSESDDHLYSIHCEHNKPTEMPKITSRHFAPSENQNKQGKFPIHD